MDEEFHKSLLQHFCRVCGGRLAKHGKTFEYSFTAHTSDLSSVFGVHIGSDYPYIYTSTIIFQTMLCKITTSQFCYKEGHRYTPVTNVMTWTQHDVNCEVNSIIQ